MYLDDLYKSVKKFFYSYKISLGNWEKQKTFLLRSSKVNGDFYGASLPQSKPNVGLKRSSYITDN